MNDIQQNLENNSSCLGGFFFFQAEDGIRDIGVTGVPDVCSSDLSGDIWEHRHVASRVLQIAEALLLGGRGSDLHHSGLCAVHADAVERRRTQWRPAAEPQDRSEERRVRREWSFQMICSE